MWQPDGLEKDRLAAHIQWMTEKEKWTVSPGIGGKFWVCHLLESGKTGKARIRFNTREEAQRCIDSGDVDKQVAIVDKMERKRHR